MVTASIDLLKLPASSNTLFSYFHCASFWSFIIDSSCFTVVVYFSKAGTLIDSSTKYNLSIFSLNFSNLKIIDRTRIATPENSP